MRDDLHLQLHDRMEVSHKRIGAHEPIILRILKYIEAMYE